jgi:release factor glutamine methyltransferase
MTVNKGDEVLDMGSGCGILAVLAAENAERVVAVDINPHAVAWTKRNAEINGVAAKIEPRIGDLFEAVRSSEQFDVILFNAPYLPVEADEGKGWLEKAWSGGETGRTVIDRFVEDAPKHLAWRGYIQMIQSTLSGVDETLKRFAAKTLIATVLKDEKLDFEKIVLIEAILKDVQ